MIFAVFSISCTLAGDFWLKWEQVMLLDDFEVVSLAHFHYAGTRPMSPHPWLTCFNISCELKKALFNTCPDITSALTYIGHYLTLLRARDAPRSCEVFEESFIRPLQWVVGEFCCLPIFFFPYLCLGILRVISVKWPDERWSPDAPVTHQLIPRHVGAVSPCVYLTVNQPIVSKLITLNLRPDTFNSV